MNENLKKQSDWDDGYETTNIAIAPKTHPITKLIYKYFADTFLIIPKILIENCNEKVQFLIPLLLLNIGRGIDKNGKIMDVDVMESFLVKKYIYISSLEIFKALFSVDCVISDQLTQRYLKSNFQ